MAEKFLINGWYKTSSFNLCTHTSPRPAGTELTPLVPGTNHIMLEKTNLKWSEKINRVDVIFGRVTTGSEKLLKIFFPYSKIL